MTKKKLPEKPQEPVSYFFMVAALVTYLREETLKQRHLNVLMQSGNLVLTKNDLNEINRSAIARVTTENVVEADAIKDVVILNVSFLGAMPPSEFHGNDQPATEAA